MSLFLNLIQKTIKSTLAVRDKEKEKQQQLNKKMQRQPDDGRNIVKNSELITIFWLLLECPRKKSSLQILNAFFLKGSS